MAVCCTVGNVGGYTFDSRPPDTNDLIHFLSLCEALAVALSANQLGVSIVRLVRRRRLGQRREQRAGGSGSGHNRVLRHFSFALAFTWGASSTHFIHHHADSNTSTTPTTNTTNLAIHTNHHQTLQHHTHPPPWPLSALTRYAAATAPAATKAFSLTDYITGTH